MSEHSKLLSICRVEIEAEERKRASEAKLTSSGYRASSQRDDNKSFFSFLLFVSIFYHLLISNRRLSGTLFLLLFAAAVGFRFMHMSSSFLEWMRCDRRKNWGKFDRKNCFKISNLTIKLFNDCEPMIDGSARWYLIKNEVQNVSIILCDLHRLMSMRCDSKNNFIDKNTNSKLRSLSDVSQFHS